MCAKQWKRFVFNGQKELVISERTHKTLYFKYFYKNHIKKSALNNSVIKICANHINECMIETILQKCRFITDIIIDISSTKSIKCVIEMIIKDNNCL